MKNHKHVFSAEYFQKKKKSKRKQFHVLNVIVEDTRTMRQNRILSDDKPYVWSLWIHDAPDTPLISFT